MEILDKRFEDNGENIILVIDFRVMLFSVLNLCKYTDNYKAIWALALNSVMPWIDDPKKGYQFIIVDDQRDPETGNYWRQDFIEEHANHLPEYKGNRNIKERPQDYFDLLEAGREYVKEKGYPYFSRNKVEADDWAGAICRMKRAGVAKGRHLFLYSVDLDWQQLSDDEAMITFVYTRNPCPISHLRGEFEIKKYYYDRQDKIISHPSEIVYMKMYEGDASDNLIAGTPEELITLMSEPPANYNTFTEQDYKNITDAMMLKNNCLDRKLGDQLKIAFNQKKYELNRSEEGINI